MGSLPGTLPALHASCAPPHILSAPPAVAATTNCAAVSSTLPQLPSPSGSRWALWECAALTQLKDNTAQSSSSPSADGARGHVLPPLSFGGQFWDGSYTAPQTALRDQAPAARGGEALDTRHPDWVSPPSALSSPGATPGPWDLFSNELPAHKLLPRLRPCEALGSSGDCFWEEAGFSQGHCQGLTVSPPK